MVSKPYNHSPSRVALARGERGRFLPSFLFLLLLVGGCLGIIAFIFGTIVPLGSVGVRKIAFGPGQGLRDASLRPGLQWAVPYYSTIYMVPQTLRILDFAPPHSLDIPTVDGTTVDVDAAVVYRFYPSKGEGGSHGGPADLIQNVGATEVQWKDRTIDRFFVSS